MAVQKYAAPTATLTDAERAEWLRIPTAIASDELNRTSTVEAGIRPITRNGPLVGLAATVRVAAGDNLALHHAVSQPGHGRVLMVDAGGYERTAVWGGILHKAAEMAGYIAVILDGCIRDSAEIVVSQVSCYARGIVPAGPHKGWGGEISSAVQVGGAVVHPGDIVLADEDGVAVIPFADRAAVLKRAQARVAMEEEIMRRLEHGETTVDIFNLEA